MKSDYHPEITDPLEMKIVDLAYESETGFRCCTKSEIGPKTTLEQAEFDSLDKYNFVWNIEDEFGIMMEGEFEYNENTTMKDVFDYVKKKQEATKTEVPEKHEQKPEPKNWFHKIIYALFEE